MTNSNFYTPTTKKFSLLELLAFYGYGVSADNSEVPTGGYVFYKKNNIKGKVLTMLGFDISKIVHRTNNYSDMENFMLSYIEKNFVDAKQIKRGIFEISM